MVAGRPVAEAFGTANVYVICLDEVVPGNSLVTTRGCDGDDYGSRLDVRPGAFSPSCVP